MIDKQYIRNPFNERKINEFDISDFKRKLFGYIENKTNNHIEYQVVILGAGKGSRMNINYPKVLYELPYPNNSLTILDNMLEGINNLQKVINIDSTTLVINESMHACFKKYDRLDNFKIIGLNDESIRGTAFCINKIKKYLQPDKDIIFLWGDLALWKVSDLYLSLKIHEINKSFITFPTRIRNNPYVAFLRSNGGKISSIMHSNEGNKHKGFAEQDCLSFICSSSCLNEMSSFMRLHQDEDEIDFIHFVLYSAENDFQVLPLPVSDYELTQGLNTQKKATKICQILKNYTTTDYYDLFMMPN